MTVLYLCIAIIWKEYLCSYEKKITGLQGRVDS